jgi:hypothetical protein
MKRNQLQMKKYLKDNGYFDSALSIDTLVGDRKVEIQYQVDSRGQYMIRNIYLPEDSSDIATIIYEAAPNSLLKTGDPYQELLLAQERTRISEVAKNKGFLEFNPNNIFYFVDTMVFGAFKSFRHEHLFKEVGAKTIMTDKFYFETPYGVLGEFVNWVYLKKYMKDLLKTRNKILKQKAEKATKSLEPVF